MRYESNRRQCETAALKTVEGMETRPTTDRIKETLFNMLQNDLYGARFLDLLREAGDRDRGAEPWGEGSGLCGQGETDRFPVSGII